MAWKTLLPGALPATNTQPEPQSAALRARATSCPRGSSICVNSFALRSSSLGSLALPVPGVPFRLLDCMRVRMGRCGENCRCQRGLTTALWSSTPFAGALSWRPAAPRFVCVRACVCERVRVRVRTRASARARALLACREYILCLHIHTSGLDRKALSETLFLIWLRFMYALYVCRVCMPYVHALYDAWREQRSTKCSAKSCP